MSSKLTNTLSLNILALSFDTVNTFAQTISCTIFNNCGKALFLFILKRQSTLSSQLTYCLKAFSLDKSTHFFTFEISHFNTLGAYHSLNKGFFNASSQLLITSKNAFLISFSRSSTSQPCSCAYKYCFTLSLKLLNLYGVTFFINSSEV